MTAPPRTGRDLGRWAFGQNADQATSSGRHCHERRHFGVGGWRGRSAQPSGRIGRVLGFRRSRSSLRAGFDRTFPSLLERGLRTPTLTVFCTIADALEVPPVELLNDTLANFHKSGGPQP